MAEFFGRNNEIEEGAYRNFVKKGNMPKPRPRPHPWNASGLEYNQCCGLAATGDELIPEPIPAPEPVNTTVRNMQAWKYAKTALAIVGAYVVVKFLYGKFVK